jgi:hypothetical protein
LPISKRTHPPVADSAEVEHLFRSKPNTVTVEAERSERSDAILRST